MFRTLSLRVYKTRLSGVKRLDTSYTDRNNVVHQTNINPTAGTRTTTASSNGFDYERVEHFASNGALIQLDETLDEANARVYASSFEYDLDTSDLNLTNNYQFNFRGDYLDHTVSTDLDSRGQIDRSTFSFQGLQNSARELWTDDFDFDWLGRQTAVERTIAAVSGDVAGIWGNAAESADKQIQYAYNVDGWRSSIDRYVASYSGGTPVASTALTYTAGGMIEQIEHSVDSSSTFLAKLCYGYDPAGRLRTHANSFKDAAGNTLRIDNRSFVYDAAGQLTQAMEFIDAGTALIRDYTDGRSSTSTAWTVTDDNRLSQDDQYNYEYSNEGQLSKRTSRLTATLGVNDVFVWDPAGRLVRVVQHDASDAVIQTIEYGYDANGLMSARRVIDSNDSITSETGYLHQGLQRVVALDLIGIDPVITELYLHGTQPNEIVATDIVTPGLYDEYGYLVEDQYGYAIQPPEAHTVWSFTDQLGSLVSVASLTGSVWDVVHTTTTEYGGEPYQLGDTDVEHLTSQRLWAGHHIDEDTGLTEAKARWYDSSAGRFISQDPMGFAAGDANLYRYVGNGPTNATDPSGHFKIPIHLMLTENAYRAYGLNNPSEMSSAVMHGLLRGVAQPDLQYVPKSAANTPAGAIVQANEQITKATEYYDRLIGDWLSEKEWQIAKSAVTIISSLGGMYETGLYDGLRGLRNWWQDTDALPAVAETLDSWLEATGSDFRLSETAIYQTHFGETAWKHAMTNGKLSAAEMQEVVSNHLASLITSYRKKLDAGSAFDAGFDLGEGVHLLQDSHSRSHVVRDSNGRIEQFQYYGEQSPGLHGRADSIRRDGDEFAAVTKVTEQLFGIANDKSLVGKRLSDALKDKFFRLAPNAVSGGSAKEFRPR